MKVFDHKHNLETNVNRSLDCIIPKEADGKTIYHFCSMKQEECTDKEYISKCNHYIKYEVLK